MKRFFKWLGIGIASLVLLVLLYGVLIEPRLIDVEHETAVIPNLPTEWEGKQVAVIGDFQVGMWLDNPSTVGRIAERLVEEQPAVVLMLGDFVYHPVQNHANEMAKVVDLIRPLAESDIPVYAVLGNHDYAMESENDTISMEFANHVRELLDALGIKVLKNEATELSLPENLSKGSSFYLVGLGASYPENVRPEKALDSVPENAPRLVMMHNPDAFDRLPAGSAPVAVAGHTHGGQIRVPFTPEWSWLTYVKDEPVHADGWIKDYGAAGNQLYVNRGIGFSFVPIRLNCPPEITIFTLEPAAP